MFIFEISDSEDCFKNAYPAVKMCTLNTYDKYSKIVHEIFKKLLLDKIQ